MTEYEGPPWCEVNWQGIRYRAATSGLLPINAATTPTKMTHVSTALDLWVLCAANPDTACGFLLGLFRHAMRMDHREHDRWRASGASILIGRRSIKEASST